MKLLLISAISSLFLLSSCGKSSGSNTDQGQGGNGTDNGGGNTTPTDNSIPWTPITPSTKTVLYFGTDGVVTVDKTTEEYTIDKLPTSTPDYSGSFLSEKNGYINTFPVNIIIPLKQNHTIFKIPETVTYNVQQGNGTIIPPEVYTFQIYLNSKNYSYNICYKFVDQNYAQFEFMIKEPTSAVTPIGLCSKIADEISAGKITPEKEKGGDYIMFTPESIITYASVDGDCAGNPNICITSQTFNLSFFNAK